MNSASRKLLLAFWIRLVPLVCVVMMWIGSAASSVDVPLWGYRGRTTSMYVSSTAFRAIEIAVVTNPMIERDSGYFYLRRNPAFLGIYFGAVANPNATRTFVMLFPYWLLFVIAASWPATSWWRRGGGAASARVEAAQQGMRPLRLRPPRLARTLPGVWRRS